MIVIAQQQVHAYVCITGSPTITTVLHGSLSGSQVAAVARVAAVALVATVALVAMVG